MQYYAAPMEGLTGYLWRQVHAALFGPADKYFTPFLSPNATRTFQRKELDEIDPAHNAGLYVVPQLLTNRGDHFVWAARELQARGYGEVNFNLGCPSGTVTAKRKGSGLLAYSEELERCLDALRKGFRDGVSYEDLYQRLISQDEYLLLADYRAYCDAERRMAGTYENRETWNRMSLHNIARSGIFAADRAVAEYADNIWDVPHR